MSGALAQNLIAGAAVLAALGYLVGRRVRRRRTSAGAECENCPVASPIAGVRPPPQPVLLQTLVTIDPGPARRDRGNDAGEPPAS